jgi:hypothetical protein
VSPSSQDLDIKTGGLRAYYSDEGYHSCWWGITPFLFQSFLFRKNIPFPEFCWDHCAILYVHCDYTRACQATQVKLAPSLVGYSLPDTLCPPNVSTFHCLHNKFALIAREWLHRKNEEYTINRHRPSLISIPCLTDN